MENLTEAEAAHQPDGETKGEEQVFYPLLAEDAEDWATRLLTGGDYIIHYGDIEEEKGVGAESADPGGKDEHSINRSAL